MNVQANAISGSESLGYDTDTMAAATEAGIILQNRVYRRLRDSRLAAVDLLLLLGTLLELGLASSLHRRGTTLSGLMQQTVAVRDLVLVALSFVLWAPLLWASGLYRQFRFAPMARRVLLASAACSLVLAVVCRVFRPEITLHIAIPLFFLAATVLLFVPRVTVILWARTGLVEGRVKRDVVILGSGKIAREMAWKLRHHAVAEYRILGFIDSVPDRGPQPGLGDHLCTLEDLEQFLMLNAIDEMHIALPVKSRYAEIEEAIRLCGVAGIEPHYPAELFSTDVTKNVESREGRVVLRMTHMDSRRLLKRGLDVTVASVGLILLSPVFLVVAAAVRCSGRGPVFFRQSRYGRNKRRFNMLKFRSMVVDAENLQAGIEHMNEAQGPVFKIARDPRITRVGAFLRKTSLDELPQLWNVLRGEMSLVGPRPLNIRDVKHFSELHLMRRFSVLPGMTGLWQVSGRSNLAFEQWIDLDLKYIDQWSLKLDLRILASTLPAVLRGRGAS